MTFEVLSAVNIAVVLLFLRFHKLIPLFAGLNLDTATSNRIVSKNSTAFSPHIYWFINPSRKIAFNIVSTYTAFVAFLLMQVCNPLTCDSIR